MESDDESQKSTGSRAKSSFVVTEYGAVGDGNTLETTAIQSAVEAAADAGGGTVVLPPGTYRSGTITLKSDVHLRIEHGAVLEGSTDLEDYEEAEVGSEFLPYDEDTDFVTLGAPLLEARDATNVGVSGYGTIFGNGDAFWDTETQHLGGFHHPAERRPAWLVRFVHCNEVTVRDVTIEHSPSWTVHLADVDSAVIEGIQIRNHPFGPNTDGLDIDGCRAIRIANCDIQAGGDDAICLKNEWKGEPELPGRPMSDVTVTNCTLSSTASAFKIGTENLAPIRDILLSNVTLAAPNTRNDDAESNFFGVPAPEDGPYNDRDLTVGIDVMMVDGAALDGFTASNVSVRGATCPLFVDVGNRRRYRELYDVLSDSPDPGSISNVRIDGLAAREIEIPAMVLGLPDEHIEDVMFSDIRLWTDSGATVQEPVALEQPEHSDTYPHWHRWDEQPAAGIWCRHVNGCSLSNISAFVSGNDARPSIVGDDVTELRVDGYRTDHWPLRLRDVRGGLLRGISIDHDARTETGVHIDGERTAAVTLVGSRLEAADEAVVVEENVAETLDLRH